jgi:hypothetical protein
MKYYPFLISVLFFSSICLGGQPKLPDAPSGYTWKICPKIKGAFLFPYGWHFKHQTEGYFITKEKIESDKSRFLTGLTVNVIKNIPGKAKVLPSQYIKVIQSKKVLIKKWTNKMGPFNGYGCEYKSKGSVIYNLLIANDKTGTLYLILYEAPENEWEEAWKIGAPILKKLYIDDEI